MLSLKKNFLFIHIPKTGGNSIQNILSQYYDDLIIIPTDNQYMMEDFEIKNKSFPSLSKHSTLMDYRRAINNDKKMEKIYKFTCVRNPWDRMISLYFYRSAKRGVFKWSKRDFINMFDKNNGMPNRTCFDYLTTRGGGNLSRLIGNNYKLKQMLGIKPEVNFIIKFEHLQTDFDNVCKEIGIPKHILPHTNKSRHENYINYYDDELITLVGEKHRDDIEYFGYKFGV